MKRIVFACVAVCSFLLLGTVIAGELKSTRDQDGTQNRWLDKGGGIWFQLVSNKDEWPEIGVLKLTNDAYGVYRNNPAKFMNDNSLFSKPVNDPSPAGVALTAPQDSGGLWYVIIGHGHMSNTYSAALPAPPTPPTPATK